MADTSGWRQYHATSRRSARIAELWSRPATRYLRSRITSNSAVLDFGCGYFDVGVALAPHAARMDGLEIDEQSLALARSRSAAFAGTTIYSRNEDVPPGTYDMVLANSVFQYLENDAAILRTLRLFRTWLKPDWRSEVTLIDLIPTNYSPVRDAMRSMWVAAIHGIPFDMSRFLWNAARSPHRREWHRIDPSRLVDLAREAELLGARRPKNLTPSLQRYTYTFLRA